MTLLVATLALVVAVVVCGVALMLMARARRDLRTLVETLPAPTEPQAGELRLAAALESFDDGIVIVDRVGREVMRNAAARRYVEPGIGDVLVADAVRRRLDAAVAGHGGEEELALFGPPSRNVVVRAVPLYGGGEAIGALAWVRDVSETRRTDQVRRDFVANVSHELKTPIGALTVLAETRALADDPAVQQQLADRVVREADRLAQIVEDLLDLSILEAQEAPNRETVPAAFIVADAIDQVRPKADAAGIPVLTTVLAADAFIACDRRQLTSAVTNLLDNAVKYSDAGDIVEVSVGATAGEVVIAVRDHGLGIPAPDLERVFERFYRVDRARSRATGGTGLGLSIVRHVVQAHGGDVAVTSVEGEGSEFTMRIPVTGTGATRSVPEEQELDA